MKPPRPRTPVWILADPAVTGEVLAAAAGAVDTAYPWVVDGVLKPEETDTVPEAAMVLFVCGVGYTGTVTYAVVKLLAEAALVDALSLPLVGEVAVSDPGFEGAVGVLPVSEPGPEPPTGYVAGADGVVFSEAEEMGGLMSVPVGLTSAVWDEGLMTVVDTAMVCVVTEPAGQFDMCSGQAVMVLIRVL